MSADVPNLLAALNGAIDRAREDRKQRGPAERYVRAYALQRQQRSTGWDETEQAIVLTLIDWKCDSELRPSSGEGSDCSDLMNVALARILGLIRGDLTPEQILASIEGQS